MTTNTPRNSTPAWQAEVTWKRRDYRVWCDLQLMPSVKHVCLIPRWGKDLIIVAAVDNVLHFRMFDGDGKSVVDIDEKRLAVPARQIEGVRKDLVGLWPPHDLTASEKDRVITAVTSIVGYTRHLEAELPDDEIGEAPQGETKRTRELHIAESVDSVREYFVDVFNAGGVLIRFRVNRRKGRSLSFTDPREQFSGTAGTAGIWGTLPEQPAGKPRSLTPTGFREELARLIGADRAEEIVRSLGA